MKSVDEMTYSDFCSAISEDTADCFRLLLDFEDFQVWVVDGLRYFYLESGVNDASDFYELELVAELTYDINHLWKDTDINCKVLKNLFDNDCCGEVVSDKDVKLLWFKRKTDN